MMNMKKFFILVSDKAQGLNEAVDGLCAGHSRDDVLERAIRTLEMDPADGSLGFGGFPNILGVMELDGAFMDGNSRNCGAVAGLTNFLPVGVARRLMQYGMHTFLVGAGAEMFARESGLMPEQTLSDFQREKWLREIKPLLDRRGSRSHMDIVGQMIFPEKRHVDTSIMIASDGRGLSGAASSSGWPYKHPGRAGDTPVIGAGLYVDSRYGGSCCTHTGEVSTRASTARFVISQMESGRSPYEAVHAAVEDVSHLCGGLLRSLVVHAIDRDGNAYAAATNAEAPVFYYYWSEDMSAPECREVETISPARSKRIESAGVEFLDDNGQLCDGSNKPREQ
jgi:isoaspartyl peptidase/L-asparaginase-like protein (Ntn-hydrolase superfamily)